MSFSMPCVTQEGQRQESVSLQSISAVLITVNIRLAMSFQARLAI